MPSLMNALVRRSASNRRPTPIIPSSVNASVPMAPIQLEPSALPIADITDIVNENVIERGGRGSEAPGGAGKTGKEAATGVPSNREAQLSDISTTGISAGLGNIGAMISGAIGLMRDTEFEKSHLGYNSVTGDYAPEKATKGLSGVPSDRLADIAENHGAQSVRDAAKAELDNRDAATKADERGFAADNANKDSQANAPSGPTKDGDVDYEDGGLIEGKLLGPNPKGPEDGKINVQKGEFVIKKPVVRVLGTPFLRAINRAVEN